MLTGKVHKETFRVMETFYILIWDGGYTGIYIVKNHHCTFNTCGLYHMYFNL